MRYLLLFLALLCSAYAFAAENDLARLKAGETIISEENYDGKSGWVKAVFWVDADPDLGYRVVSDSSKFPEFMMDLKECRVDKVRNDGSEEVYFLGGKSFVKIEYTLHRRYDPKIRKVWWNLLKGDISAADGYWLVEVPPDGKGSVITYSTFLDTGKFVPEFVVQYVQKKSLGGLVENVKKRILSKGTWQSPEYLERAERTKEDKPRKQVKESF